MLYLTTLCEVFSIFFPSNYPVGQATVAPHLPRRPTGACPALQNTPNRICWLAGYGLAVLPVSLVALSDRPEVRLTVCAFSSQGNATRTLTISLLAFAYCFQLFTGSIVERDSVTKRVWLFIKWVVVLGQNNGQPNGFIHVFAPLQNATVLVHCF